MIQVLLEHLLLVDFGKLISNLGLGGGFSQFLQDAGREPYIK